MRAIRLLALRRLRLQPLRALIAAITVGAGASLAVAILITSSSLDRSVREEGAKLAGPTPLRIVGATTRGGIDESVVAKAEAVDGVAAAIPLVQAVTLADGANSTSVPVVALGVDCRVEALVGSFNCSADALTAAAAVNAPPAVSSTLVERLGAGATLRTDTRRVPLEQAIVLPALDALNGGRTVVFPLAQAQAELARPGALDIIYIQPAPGTDVGALKHRLQEAVGPVNGVLGSTDPPPLVGVILLAFLPLFSILALLVLAIGSVLVHNTVTLSMEERRRQLAIVGALGGTARTIVGGVLVEATMLGLVGGVLGAAGGALIAGPITNGLSDFTEKTTGIPLQVHLEPGTLVVALIVGVVVSVLSSIRPARRAMRLDVAAELSGRDQRDERSHIAVVRRAVIWAGVAVVGLNLCVVAQHDGALEPWQAALAPIAFIVAIAGLALLGGAIAPMLIRALGPIAGSRSASVRLATANLVRDPGRTGVMAVAVSLAVGTAFLTTSYTHSVRQDITESLTRNLRGVQVSTLEPNNTANVDSKMPPEVIEKIRQLPGVGTVRRGAVVIVGHESTDLISVFAYEDPWFDVAVIRGVANEEVLAAGQGVIGPSLARQEGLREGDELTLDTPKRQVKVPIAAIWQNGDSGGRNLFISYELLNRLFGEQPVIEINVEPAPGTTAEQLATTIRDANLDPSLRVSTARELAAEVSDSLEEQIAPFWALQRGLLVMAFIAVLSTLLLVGVQRQRELGLLAAVGMRPSELARMVFSEALTVSLTGVVLGILSSLVMLKALLLVTPVLLGYKNDYAVDVSAFLIYCPIGVLIALLAAALPAWRTARVEVLEALQYE